MKRFLFLGLLVAFAAALYGTYLFYKKPADIRSETAAFSLTADELVTAFTINEDAATKKFSNQVIRVSGKVSEINFNQGEGSVILTSPDPMTGITCSFYTDETENLKKLTPGSDVTIKGKCTGKLFDIVLNDCSLVEDRNEAKI